MWFSYIKVTYVSFYFKFEMNGVFLLFLLLLNPIWSCTIVHLQEDYPDTIQRNK